MADFDWEADVRGWCQGQGDISFSLTERIVDFFRLSFQNTQCPENAWFGCHSTRVSLVVGGIYLAAIQRTGKDRGAWLVVDQNPPELSGVEYQPILSTQCEHPLV